MKADNNNPFEYSPFNSAFHDDRVMDSMLSKMIQSDTDRQQFLDGCMQKISELDSNEELRILGDEGIVDSYADTKRMQAEAVQLMGLAAVLLVGCFMYSMFLALKTPERVYTASLVSNSEEESESSLIATIIPSGNGAVNYSDDAAIEWDEYGDTQNGGISEPVGELDLEQAIAETAACGELHDLWNSTNDKIAPEVVESLFAEESIPRRRLNIDLKFSRTGRAYLALNDDVISRNLRAFEAQNVLVKFVPELQQRSSFLGPRLGKVFGAIVIDRKGAKTDFRFESISEIKKAFHEASLELAKIGSSYISDSIRSRVAFKSIVQKTNGLFQGWAQDAIEAGVCETPMYQDPAEKYSRVIGRSKFEWFASTGEFEVEPERLYMAETTIQHLDSGSLQTQLAQRSQELSLFKDSGEFNTFKNVHTLPSNSIDRVETQRGVQPIQQLVQGRADLLGLPMVMGKECHLDRERADSLDLVSRELGPAMSMSLAARNQQHINHISKQQLHVVANRLPDYSGDSQKLMTVDQMVQHESPKLKHDFIGKLGRERCQVNANLLVCYAKFDLDSGVRMAATRALASYEPEMYRKKLLDGFFYPWDVVAQHSAEALVRLNDTGSIAPLVKFLLAPHPGQPYKNKAGGYVRRELVAVNHMKNCVLCHGVSYSASDPGRAVVPEWTRPIARNYYNPGPEIPGLVARADITYLRQDFSVVQPVKDHGHWPANQRFDYLVRESPYIKGDTSIAAGGDRKCFREAVVFALRMLTDKSPAIDNYDTWKEIVDEFESLAP